MVMEIKMVSEVLADLNDLMQLSAQEDFVAFCHCKSFRTYVFCSFLYTSCFFSCIDLAFQNMV